MKIKFENCNCATTDGETVRVVAPKLTGRYESVEDVVLDVAWDPENHELVKTTGKLVLEITED